jgi:hypothetical protein
VGTPAAYGAGLKAACLAKEGKAAAESCKGSESTALPWVGENRRTNTCITHDSFVLNRFSIKMLRFGHPKITRVPRLTEI